MYCRSIRLLPVFDATFGLDYGTLFVAVFSEAGKFDSLDFFRTSTLYRWENAACRYSEKGGRGGIHSDKEGFTASGNRHLYRCSFCWLYYRKLYSDEGTVGFSDYRRGNPASLLPCHRHREKMRNDSFQ